MSIFPEVKLEWLTDEGLIQIENIALSDDNVSYQTYHDILAEIEKRGIVDRMINIHW